MKKRWDVMNPCPEHVCCRVCVVPDKGCRKSRGNQWCTRPGNGKLSRYMVHDEQQFCLVDILLVVQVGDHVPQNIEEGAGPLASLLSMSCEVCGYSVSIRTVKHVLIQQNET